MEKMLGILWTTSTHYIAKVAMAMEVHVLA